MAVAVGAAVPLGLASAVGAVDQLGDLRGLRVAALPVLVAGDVRDADVLPARAPGVLFDGHLRAALGALSIGALIAGAVALDDGPASASPVTDSESWLVSGDYDFVVPAGVTSVTIEVAGAHDLRHGEAVAIGLVFAAELAHEQLAGGTALCALGGFGGLAACH